MLKYAQASTHPNLMRKAVLNGFYKVETTCEFESVNCANVGVAVKWKFDPKEMLEEVSVGASLKRQSET
jgi:hypothetical protein